MRRKSERNKAKSSPEKKPEKPPTRKSTRRRGKRSPSTSPERENSNDAGTLSTRESDGESTTHMRLQTRACDTIDEAPENNVSSTETVVKLQEQEQPQSPEQQPQQQQQQQQQQQPEEEEDAGSVWKVARADASPGEIQKLKLCRQRNMSETSDASSSRKRTNKWHEGGEGVAEEVDSADEPSSAASKAAIEREEPAEETNSAAPGRDSSEEVSDSKEIPPETASAELSDDKPNVDDDRQGETIATPLICTAVERVDDNEPVKPEPAATEATTAIEPDSNGEPSEEEIPKEDTSANAAIAVEEPAAIVSSADDDKPVVENQEDAKGSKQLRTEDEEKTEGSSIKATKGPTDSSEDNSDEKQTKSTATKTLSRTTSRRKHRDKYRDSSNSDTAESEDDVERVKRDKKIQENKKDKEVVKAEVKEVEKASRTPETRPETPVDNDTPMKIENYTIETEKPNEVEKSERIDEAIVIAPIVQSQNNYKPAKVNLKRSFAGRPSADTNETKKEGNDNHTNELATQDKENHVSSDQVDPKSIPKKRRWGTILTSASTTPAFSVSTDSLKVLVPGAKPLSITEVRLSKDDDEDKERRSQREKRYSTSEATSEHKSREDGEKPKHADAKKDAKGDNHIASRRKISIIKDTTHKSPSPSAAIPTSILLIKNLVRPFTLNQIRELLSRTGTIVENGFWMDRIKSKCFVEYSNEDQAFETRQALHGISWPVSNPKRLQVEYASKEDMALARELSKDQPTARKTEPLAANDGWQQDWARDEKPNAAMKVTVVREWDLGKEDGQHFGKDKEREKKDHDKKRRQRSRSPALEAHLPAPARKFKKKEDDPPPAKLLDDLFRKTKATPCIYWLPLTNEQIVVKEEMRRQHMAEHARRLEEMRRAERNRDGRRRRSPRK